MTAISARIPSNSESGSTNRGPRKKAGRNAAEPIEAAAVYREGILVQAPRPERFAIHKLVVADRRRDHLKALKDLMQSELLVAILAEDRPADLAEAYEDAMDRGPKWRERIEASLKRLPETRARIDACL
jgi:hypothetical protein